MATSPDTGLTKEKWRNARFAAMQAMRRGDATLAAICQPPHRIVFTIRESVFAGDQTVVAENVAEAVRAMFPKGGFPPVPIFMGMCMATNRALMKVAWQIAEGYRLAGGMATHGDVHVSLMERIYPPSLGYVAVAVQSLIDREALGLRQMDAGGRSALGELVKPVEAEAGTDGMAAVYQRIKA